MLDLTSISADDRRVWAREYENDGLVRLPDVGLPPGFVPPQAELVFLRIDDGACEVYLPNGIRCETSDESWRMVFSRPTLAGVARLLLWAEGGFDAAVAETGRMLATATEKGQSEVTSLTVGGEEEGRSAAPPVQAKRVLYSTPRVDKLTDLAAVHEGIGKQAKSVLINETALYAEMAKTVRGQDNALRLLSSRVCRHLAKHEPRRPLTVFSVGPTGVGKTESARTLPKAIKTLVPDGEAYAFLRLDMSEYQERHRLSQLTGAPQGYVGYQDGAQLSDALAANPRTVVLFDEIEKSHPDILKFLMNAMDAGRLSTSAPTAAGREIDCRKAIFIFTSNIDASGILTELEQRGAFDEPAVVDEVCRNRLKVAGIAPELVGRISCFLVFKPLSPEVQAEVVTLAIVNIGREYGVEVGHIEPTVIIAIMEQTRAVNFGARPFEYLIEEVLGLCFAEAVVAQVLQPVEVQGPPFTCAPWRTAADPEVADGEALRSETSRD